MAKSATTPANPLYKLSRVDAADIRIRAEWGEPVKALAAEYNISTQKCYRVIQRKFVLPSVDVPLEDRDLLTLNELAIGRGTSIEELAGRIIQDWLVGR